MATTIEAPTDVQVRRPPLSDQQRRWVEQAVALIDEEKIRRFNLELTRLHSPTGEEAAASRWLASAMRDMGLDSFYQPVDEASGNAVGRAKGAGEGASLLLYAPIDTHLRADPEEDVPWVGPQLDVDMVPDAFVAENGDVIGLGASNPKGMASALAEAVRVVVAAGVALKGDVILGYAGGGMPTMPRTGAGRRNHGLGSGVTYMLNHGVAPDFAIICKPGWAVSWEEVGLCWFKVTVNGDMGYAGISRTIPGFRNSVVHAATVIQELEAWLPEYQRRNTSGLCSPQGAISAVRGGWPHKPAFPSAATEIYLDIRCTPRVPPSSVRAQFQETIEAIKAKHPELSLEWEMFGSYPGGHTAPESWVVQSAMRGWEYVEGKEHRPRANSSGQTDASAIRNLGVPTARIGPPGVPTMPKEWRGLRGMGVSYIPDLARVAKAVVYAIVDTCTRRRDEVMSA